MLTPVENGVDVRQISKLGSTLEIHYQDYDDLFQKSSTTATVEDTLGHPIGKSFKEVALELTDIDERGFVKKKTLEEGGGEVINENCVIGFAYSGYFEGETAPFDLKPPVKPQECKMKDNILLCGLQNAILSMKVGEVSMFLLSYKVMYGEMGNPPKVKPKADCLFFIKIIRCQWAPKEIDPDEEPNMFTRMFKEAKVLYKNGWAFYKNSNIPMAIRCFNRAVNMMHHTRLADEEEEKKQEDFLLKLYLNLAICYNRSKNPRRACCMCNEINRLQTIWKNGKALYQNAKALRMIGDFRGAERRLKRAMQLCPDMKDEMEGEMNKIYSQIKAYEYSKLMAIKILDNSNSDIVSEEFKKEVTNLVKQFVHDPEICKITLPKTLSSGELKYLQYTAKQFKVTCATVENDFSLDKTITSENNESIFDD